MSVNLHGTALRLGTRGLMIRGPAGSGKSSLALSLLRRAEAAGVDARLVSDDQIFVKTEGDRLRAEAPRAIAGRIEVRGIGILRERHEARAFIDLVIDLVPRGEIVRLPEAETADVEGVRVRRVRIAERDPAFGADLLLTLVRCETFWDPIATT